MPATQSEGADRTEVETQRAPSPENAETEEAEKTALADASDKPESGSAVVGEKRKLPKEVRVELKKFRKKAAQVNRLKEQVAQISKEKNDAEKSANEALTKHNQLLQKRLKYLEASIGGEHSVISPPETFKKATVPAETQSSVPIVEDQPSPVNQREPRKPTKKQLAAPLAAEEVEKAKQGGARHGVDLVPLRSSPSTSTFSKL